MADGGRERKKRKWDVPGELPRTGLPGQGAPGLGSIRAPFLQGMQASPGAGVTSQAFLAVAQQNAAALVQKINQDLVARGVLPPSQIEPDTPFREITINDAEPSIRYRLTKRTTQEEIQAATGCVVITRGRYRPPNATPDLREKPLFLHISPATQLTDPKEQQAAVDRGAAKVEQMLRGGALSGPHPPPPYGDPVPRPSYGAPYGQVRPYGAVPPQSYGAVLSPGGSSQGLLTAVVEVPIDAAESYDLPSRIRGPNNSYLSHISSETGAMLDLRGKGSFSDPLQLIITCQNPQGLSEAQRLAQNLIDTVKADWSRAQTQAVYNQTQYSGYGYQAPQYPSQQYHQYGVEGLHFGTPTGEAPYPALPSHPPTQYSNPGQTAPYGQSYPPYNQAPPPYALPTAPLGPRPPPSAPSPPPPTGPPAFRVPPPQQQSNLSPPPLQYSNQHGHQMQPNCQPPQTYQHQQGYSNQQSSQNQLGYQTQPSIQGQPGYQNQQSFESQHSEPPQGYQGGEGGQSVNGQKAKKRTFQEFPVERQRPSSQDPAQGSSLGSQGSGQALRESFQGNKEIQFRSAALAMPPPKLPMAPPKLPMAPPRPPKAKEEAQGSSMHGLKLVDYGEEEDDDGA